MEYPRLSYCSRWFNLNDLDDWFNITVTFKSDSDFVVDYQPFNNINEILYDQYYIYEFKILLNATNNNPKKAVIESNKYKKKQKSSIVWFVSHCETNSKREDYVLELMKYVQVDIYGNCKGNFF